MGSIRRQVNRIVDDELVALRLAALRGSAGSELAPTAVSRAAYAAGRLATGSSVPANANYLGVSIREPLAPIRDERKEYYPKLSQEIRDKFGYGNLPDDLIRAVGRQVAPLVPDSGISPDFITLCAARTMSLVSDRPDMSPASLRDAFLRVEPDHPLMVAKPTELSPAELACIDSVVSVAQYVTADYYGVQQTAGERL